MQIDYTGLRGIEILWAACLSIHPRLDVHSCATLLTYIQLAVHHKSHILSQRFHISSCFCLPVTPICATIKFHLEFSEQMVKIGQYTCTFSSLFSFVINQRLYTFNHQASVSSCIYKVILSPFSIVCPS